MKPLDITGSRFGRLVGIEYVTSEQQPNGKYRRIWKCRCDCGVLIDIRIDYLTSGDTQSCGCLLRDINAAKRARSLKHTPEYTSWVGMRQRCQNPSNHAYGKYGARGIDVCERWNTFENFLEDMGPKPTHDHSIERIDNNGGYRPDNCRWATNREQCNNRRTNARIIFNGETRTIAQWASITGIHHSTIWNRARRGWSPDKILTTPTRRMASAHHS